MVYIITLMFEAIYIEILEVMYFNNYILVSFCGVRITIYACKSSLWRDLYLYVCASKFT